MFSWAGVHACAGGPRPAKSGSGGPPQDWSPAPRCLPYVLLLVCGVALAQPPDPNQIVNTALELSRRSEHLAQHYAYTQQTIKRTDGHSQTSDTFAVEPIEGEPLSRLIARNGKPLPADEAARARAKFDAAVRERRSETPAARKRRLAKYEENLNRRRELMDEIPRAFTFHITGEERIAGHDAWRIEARPRPGYQPRSMRASILTKMTGTFWISKQHNRLIKLDAVTTGPVSFGWVLAKVAPGTRITIEQMMLPDGTWVAKRFHMLYDMRIALLKHSRGETEHLYSEYRKVD